MQKKLEREVFYRGHPYRVVASRKKFMIYRLGCMGHETLVHSEKRDDPQQAFYDNVYVGRNIKNKDPFWERARVADDVTDTRTEARKESDSAVGKSVFTGSDPNPGQPYYKVPLADIKSGKFKPEDQGSPGHDCSGSSPGIPGEVSTIRYDGPVKATVPTVSFRVPDGNGQVQANAIVDEVLREARNLEKVQELTMAVKFCNEIRTNGKIAAMMQDSKRFVFTSMEKGQIVNGAKPYRVGWIQEGKEPSPYDIALVVDPVMRWDEDKAFYFVREKPVRCTKFENITA